MRSWVRCGTAVLVGVLVVPASAAAANFTVSNNGDAALQNPSGTTCVSTLGGTCTLRAAIQAADNLGGASTITLPGGHYKLTTPPTGTTTGSDTNDPVHGDLDVRASVAVTIKGAGSGSTIVDAGGLDRAFAVQASGALSLSGVTIENGSAAVESSGSGWGGGIYSEGALHLTADVTMRDNFDSSGGYGGALISIGAGAALTITGATFVDNVSADYGGAVDVDSAGGAQITNTTFLDNSAVSGYGGAINVESSSGPLLVSGSRFIHNDAENGEQHGGAIAYSGSATLTVTGSTFDHNLAAEGGAIFDYSSTALTVSSSSFVDNTAASGGAVYIDNIVATPNVFTDDEFDGNRATGDGGAINWQYGTLSVTRSTLSGNVSAGDGGGLYVDETTSLTLTDDTISGNEAGSGGGVYFADDPAIALTNDTIAFNAAVGGGGGGIYRPSYTAGGAGVVNTLVADNGGGDCGYPPTPSQFNATDDRGNNLDSDSTCFGGLSKPGDKVGVDPLLAPAAANGGPVMTDALGAHSPAVDAANGSACPATDARGVGRPQGAGCDIGAFELSTLTVSVSSPIPGKSYAQGAKVKATFSCSEAGIPGLIASCTGTTASGQRIPTATAGSHTFSVTGVDRQGQRLTKTVQYRVTGRPPATKITGHTVSGHSVTIEFKGSGGSSKLSFRCKLDGGSFARCHSPKTYKGLASGRHTIEVQARDSAGHADASPAKLSFKVHG